MVERCRWSVNCEVETSFSPTCGRHRTIQKKALGIQYRNIETFHDCVQLTIRASFAQTISLPFWVPNVEVGEIVLQLPFPSIFRLNPAAPPFRSPVGKAFDWNWNIYTNEIAALQRILKVSTFKLISYDTVSQSHAWKMFRDRVSPCGC
jgi:hypothetical protein